MPPESPLKNYEYLGQKTLWLFIAQKSAPTLLFLLAAIVVAALKHFATSVTLIPQNILSRVFSVANWFIFGSLIIFVVSCGLMVLIAWLDYKNYRFILDEFGLKIHRGILGKEEIAIPYRQIQNVDIERSLLQQLFGVSRIVILTAGHEDSGDSKDISEGVLPIIDSKKALEIQEQLLKRSSIQEVISAKQSAV